MHWGCSFEAGTERWVDFLHRPPHRQATFFNCIRRFVFGIYHIYITITVLRTGCDWDDDVWLWLELRFRWMQHATLPLLFIGVQTPLLTSPKQGSHNARANSPDFSFALHLYFEVRVHSPAPPPTLSYLCYSKVSRISASLPSLPTHASSPSFKIDCVSALHVVACTFPLLPYPTFCSIVDCLHSAPSPPYYFLP